MAHFQLCTAIYEQYIKGWPKLLHAYLQILNDLIFNHLIFLKNFENYG